MEVTDRDRQRRKLGERISYARAMDADFGAVAPLDREGRSVVVPMLESDTVHAAVALVRSAGGAGLVVVQSESDDATYSWLRMTMRESHTGDLGDCHVPVGPSCTLGDLLRIFAPGSSVTIRLAGDELQFDDIGPTGEGELVDC